MVLYFRLLSNDAEDFIMEVAVNASATFMDIHTFIQKSLEYDSSNMASFVITDNEWNRQKEISLMKMNDEDDVLLMEATTLEKFIGNVKQRLLYVFDFFSERAFFMEVFDVKEGEIAETELLRLEGKIPEQIVIDDILTDETLLPDYPDEEEFGEGFDDIDSFDPDNFPDLH